MSESTKKMKSSVEIIEESDNEIEFSDDPETEDSNNAWAKTISKINNSNCKNEKQDKLDDNNKKNQELKQYKRNKKGIDDNQKKKKESSKKIKPSVQVREGSESEMESDANSIEIENASDVNDSCDEFLSDEENNGNVAWADAMAKVLNAKTPSDKSFILSKAKKDSEIDYVKQQKVELVDSSGKVIETSEPKEKNKICKSRKEMLEKQKHKYAWENMCRVKPEVTNKEKEKELVRIATRGVVHLFNAVEKHQKTLKIKPKGSKKKKKEKEIKGNFLDMLNFPTKSGIKSQGDAVMEKVKEEESWSILKDDFMKDAQIKDWDEEIDNT